MNNIFKLSLKTQYKQHADINLKIIKISKCIQDGQSTNYYTGNY